MVKSLVAQEFEGSIFLDFSPCLHVFVVWMEGQFLATPQARKCLLLSGRSYLMPPISCRHFGVSKARTAAPRSTAAVMPPKSDTMACALFMLN